MTQLGRRAFLRAALASVGIAAVGGLPAPSSGEALDAPKPDAPKPDAPKLEPGDSWDSPSADILADFKAAQELIERSGGLRPNVLVIGQDAYRALLENFQVDISNEGTRNELRELFGIELNVYTPA